MTYQLDGKEYSVEIVKKNNKHIYVRVKDDLTIYVTASYFTTKKQIQAVLNSNQKFLRKAIAKTEKKDISSDRISYLGKGYRLIVSKYFEDIEFLDNKIYTPSIEYFQKWQMKKIKVLFSERYDFWYQQFEEKIPFFPLKFRKMKTRWGVCNRKSKTITLNTKLLEYDICCLDYVIVHELSHLIEFNHSYAFWKIVAKYCPDYKSIRKILKD